MAKKITYPPPNEPNFLRLRLQPEFGRMPVAEMPLTCVFGVAGGGALCVIGFPVMEFCHWRFVPVSPKLKHVDKTWLCCNL